MLMMERGLLFSRGKPKGLEEKNGMSATFFQMRREKEGGGGGVEASRVCPSIRVWTEARADWVAEHIM